MTNIIQKWQKKHLQQLKQKAGARYTPELNVDLPISEVFDGICRTERFYIKIREKYGEILREFNHIASSYEKAELQKVYEKIKKLSEELFELIDSIKTFGNKKIPWMEISKKAEELSEILWKFSHQLREERDLIKSEQAPPSRDGSYQQSLSEKYNSNIHFIFKVQDLIYDFKGLAVSDKAKLSNHPFLLLTGPAGTGKTHLLCDIAAHRIKNKLPTFMVFGEYFSRSKDFWSQFLMQLEFGRKIKTKKDFLTMIDELGEKTQTRSLIIIDALNENITHTPNYWKDNLDKIIEDIKKYPHIALAISVRNGFEGEVLTEKQKSFFLHLEHQGFRFKEWEAVNKFFSAFFLPLPEIPLLTPEFQSPLFLLLFCKAFVKRKNKKERQIFRGHEGATYIFESFILNATELIAQKFKIPKGASKSPAYRVWNEIIKEMALEMVEQNDDRIQEEKLIQIIQKTYPNIESGEFLHTLESHTLIVKVPRYNENYSIDGFDVKFPFQKFSDHLIGRYIFKKFEDEFGKHNKNKVTAKKFFSKRRKLGKYLSKSGNRGIVEALSIQCPEQLKGIEFTEITPYFHRDKYLFGVALDSFVESLVWRDPKSFSKDERGTLSIINKFIVTNESRHHNFLNSLLSVAPIPNHPFNADRLHDYLFKISVPQRDSWWSTFLHYQHGRQGAVDRLLEWSWSDQDKKHLSDESILLTVTAMSWFLTTSDRFVRDKTTKGLVCLLQNRTHLLPLLLEKFKDVNDPYITERLYAVAYGCALRFQGKKEDLKLLALWVYENVFKDNRPPVHILLRDYARGVIEVALRKGTNIKIDTDKINPPYQSEFPKNIPTEEELQKKYKYIYEQKGYIGVWFSVMSWDFARYVLGTNSWSSEWSGRSLNNPEPRREVIFQKFKNSLNEKQQALLKEAANRFSGIHLPEGSNIIKILESGTKVFTKEELEKEDRETEKRMKKAYNKLLNSLETQQRQFFDQEIEPYLNKDNCITDPLETFDLKLMQRWIIDRVGKLGWHPDLHDKFDRDVNSNITNRQEHKAERLGKKYQWIAYHEFLALIADHYEFKEEHFDSEPTKYKGAWNPRVRDIDTSFILQDDSHVNNSIKLINWRKKHGIFNMREKNETDSAWLRKVDVLPNSKKIIQLADDDGKEWLMLEGLLNWKEEIPPEHKENYNYPSRVIWYMIKSYLVKRGNAKKFFAWSKKQDFMGRWMPESHNIYEIFLGEYPHSLAFEDLRHDSSDWVKSAMRAEDLPVPVVVTDASYLNEFTLDCSHNGSVSVKLPCKWLVNQMHLNHKHLDGRFYGSNGNLITISTSIFEENFPSALLIEKKALIDFLEANNYSIVWTLLGEKHLIGDMGTGNRGMLEISGAYTLSSKHNIVGKSHSKFT